MNSTIRLLRADEIDARIQSTKDNGCVLLLYKDARCDMRILDEVYGVTGWQRSHEVVNGNLFCTVEIWDSEKKQWIKKQDVGTESNTEKEKGQASDSFKRACFNIGIGRELYTAPFIWINAIKDENIKYTKFTVTEIGFNKNKEISSLSIVDDKGRLRYSFKDGKSQRLTTEIPQSPPVADQVPKIDEPSDIIFEMINKADSQELLKEIWTSYPVYQRNQKFKNAITNAKKKFPELQPTS